MAGTFRDLIAWQKAILLSKAIYRLTNTFPETERFGLVVQMRRAAVSIASNIAEGNARQSLKDYIHLLVIARGSLAELETQLIIAREIDLTRDIGPTQDIPQEARRVLQGLIDSLRAKRDQERRTEK